MKLRLLAGFGQALSYLEWVLRLTWDALLAGLLSIVLIRPGWQVLRRGYKDYDTGQKRTFDVDHARLFWEMTNDASEHTDDKVRQLLTLSSALTPVAIVLAKLSRPQFLGWLIAASLVAAVLLCVGAIFDVPPEPDDEVVDGAGVDVLRQSPHLL